MSTYVPFAALAHPGSGSSSRSLLLPGSSNPFLLPFQSIDHPGTNPFYSPPSAPLSHELTADLDEEVDSWRRAGARPPVAVRARLAARVEAKRRAVALAEGRERDHLLRLADSGAENATWIPDEACRVCFRCDERFTLLRRRHHCRSCGLVFCGNCASKWVTSQIITGVPLMANRDAETKEEDGRTLVRVCLDCAEIAKRVADSYGPSRKRSVIPIEDPALLQQQQHSQHKTSGTGSVSADETASVASTTSLRSAASSVSSTKPATGGRSLLPRALDLMRKREREMISRWISRRSHVFASMSEGEFWSTACVRLARRACDRVRPDPFASDALDASCYVHVVCAPGGSKKKETRIVDGAVLKRGLLHREMPTSRQRPRILLLASGIELERGRRFFFHRETASEESAHAGAEPRATDRLASLDDLLGQERLYLELVVRKILELDVAVLLVGGSVSRLAQELLVARRVSVYANVSRPELEWISRLTDAVLLPTTEFLTRDTDPTGSCASWRVELLEGDRFSFFEGCAPATKGCTAFLRGETSAALTKLASLLRELCRRVWTVRLDHALLHCLDDAGVPRLAAGGTRLPVDALYGPELELRPHPMYAGMCADDVLLESESIELARVWTLGEQTQQSLFPESKVLTFFGSNDRSLGEFLLRHCFEAKSVAWAQSAADELEEDERVTSTSNPLTPNLADGRFALAFIHGHSRVRVSTTRKSKGDAEELEALAGSRSRGTTILTWGVCRCGEQTSVRPLTSLASGISLGRFLQFFISARGARSPGCVHSLTHDAARFFFQGTCLVRVEHETVRPLRFEVKKRLERDEEWMTTYAEALLAEFAPLALRVKELFVEKLYRAHAPDELVASVHRKCEDLSDRRGLLTRGGAVGRRPGIANRLFRDLFVCAVEWNAQLASLRATQLRERSPLPVGSDVPVARSRSAPAPDLEEDVRRSSSSLSLGTTSPGLLASSATTRVGSDPLLESPRSTPAGHVARSLSASRLPMTRRASSGRIVRVHLPEIQDGLERMKQRRPSGGLAAGGSGFKSYSDHVFLASMSSDVSLPARLVEGHPLLPSGRWGDVVPVRENEPTSWIAHALGSNEYQTKLTEYNHAKAAFVELMASTSAELPGSPAAGSAFATLPATASPSEPPSAAGAGSLPNLLDEEDAHIRCGFTDASEYSPRQCTFSVTSYFASSFHALRRAYLAKPEEEEEEEASERWFIESLSRCSVWKPTGGKTSAAFFKTLDDRFIVKSVSSEEFEMFKLLAPRYFDHLKSAYTGSGDTALVPFLGMFAVNLHADAVRLAKPHKSEVGTGSTSATTTSAHESLTLASHASSSLGSSAGGSSSSNWGVSPSSSLNNRVLVVLPNLWYKRDCPLRYDLKGNLRNRMVKDPEPGAVRLDVNFHRDHGGVPLSLTPQGKQALTRAVNADAAFLASCDVIDYSLLVGVCERTGELVAGIIDYLQLYNFRKRVESTVKKAGMVAGQSEPTVISPGRYATRLCASLDRCFVAAPLSLLVPRETKKQAGKEVDSEAALG